MATRDRISQLWLEPPSPLAREGYSLPNLNLMQWYSIGSAENDNWVAAPKGVDWTQSREIKFSKRSSGNALIFGYNSKAVGKFDYDGTNNIGIFGEENPYHLNVQAYFIGNSGIIFFGARSTANSVAVWTHGNATSVIIGDDVMIASGVYIRTSDDHAIIDLVNGNHVNPPKSVLIEPHVWLCPEAHILKGSRVGAGSIIGARSVVTGHVPRASLAIGTPARVIRSSVSWDRPLFPRRDIHLSIQSLLDKMAREEGQDETHD
jgi:acetyltransferase-like isoleucine patch superfamily enzyme